MGRGREHPVGEHTPLQPVQDWGWGAGLAAGRLSYWAGTARDSGGPPTSCSRSSGGVHPLLIHPLGLDPLDEAEEVLVGHGGAAGWHPRGRRAALVIDSGGLGR